VGLLAGVLSLAREPARLTLLLWERGLSGAASAARLGLELLDSGRGGHQGAAYRKPPPTSYGNGGPPAVPDELIPDHVDEEVVLVAEVAEEGAEDGAGPELQIDPPWDGYDQMTSDQICDRLVAATAELAAAVELYESVGRARPSVLEAADRALRT
jgi:hypothetical protein